ncbi:MAG: DUF333 domain-containing protein [Deltaproteobacteria bacterium]|nr:DUF333 domain-containing protein [Deltaproteobacteria bacterium]
MRRFVIALAAIVLPLACGQVEKRAPEAPGAAAVKEPAPSDNVRIANPASVNCVKNGGRLEIRTEAAGQYGVCVFADGSRCEEWAFFRGECRPGTCRDDSGRCPGEGK